MLSEKVKRLSEKAPSGTGWRRRGGQILSVLAIFGLAACYYPAPYQRVVVVRPAPVYASQPSVAPVAPVFFYPKVGQTPAQQDRDRYECYNWAVSQTGFNPALASTPPEQRVVVTPVPTPGHDTAVMGVGGAVIGALIGGPRHALGGALIGGAAGAVAGAASDSARQESARQTEAAINSQRNQASAFQYTGQANNFRRAMSACLEGRGYTVQ
jgi:hypothetical protein